MTAPSRRDKLRPLEFLLIAGVLALFAGLIVIATTREPLLAIVSFGIAFIVTLVTIALLELGMKPNEAEKLDLDEQEEVRKHDASHGPKA